MSLWTHAICVDCWNRRHPKSPAPMSVRHVEGAAVPRCCFCLEPADGIYVRYDPLSPDLKCEHRIEALQEQVRRADELLQRAEADRDHAQGRWREEAEKNTRHAEDFRKMDALCASVIAERHELRKTNTRLWAEVERMSRALTHAAAVVESGRQLAVYAGAASSERAFTAAVAEFEAAAVPQVPRAASDNSANRQPPPGGGRVNRIYSEKPSAVRMRRMREKQKRRRLEQLGLAINLEDSPRVITWQGRRSDLQARVHCGCGAQIVVYDAGQVQPVAWLDHRRACLFNRASFPVVLERPAEQLEAAPAAAAGAKP